MSAPRMCVIEVGHRGGELAEWENADHPEHAVCDRHKGQYETAFDDYGHILWVPIDAPYSGRSEATS